MIVKQRVIGAVLSAALCINVMSFPSKGRLKFLYFLENKPPHWFQQATQINRFAENGGVQLTNRWLIPPCDWMTVGVDGSLISGRSLDDEPIKRRVTAMQVKGFAHFSLFSQLDLGGEVYATFHDALGHSGMAYQDHTVAVTAAWYW